MEPNSRDMMRIRARLYGTVRRFSLPETPGCWAGELPQGATIADLLVHLEIEPREVAAASISGQMKPFDTQLRANDEVVLVTPIGGG